jgi:methyl-accepting chemotaxis protein
MKEKINPHGMKLFITSFVLLLAVFSLITVSGFFGLTQINQRLLQDSRAKQEVLNILRDLRMNFVSEHNAITYGISKGLAQSSAIYKEAEKKLQECFTRLRSTLKDRDSLANLNSLISCQTMFSEQISRLFGSLQYAGGQSLTYDELTDIKSYRLQTLNEANAYAANFDKALNELETSTAAGYNRDLTTIISSLQRMKFYFLLLGAVLFVLSLVFSFNFARRATDPMTTTSGLIREMVRSNYTMNIDYTRIDNADVRDILRTFSTAISTFKTFIMRITESVREISEMNKAVSGGIHRLRKAEVSKKDLHGREGSVLSSYIQDLENTGFYSRQIRDQINGLQDVKNSVVKSLSAIAEKTSHLIEGQSRSSSQVYAFNEIAERINNMALTISLEASKSGMDAHQLSVITSEIRRLVSQAVESNRNFARIVGENKSALAGFRENVQTSLRELSGMDPRFEEIGMENSQIRRVIEKGTALQNEFTGNEKKSDGMKNETVGPLADFEKLNRQLEDELKKLAKECKQYSDMNEEINYTRVKNADDLAEKAVFGNDRPD